MAKDSITGTVIAERYKVTGFLRPGRMGDLYVARRVGDNQKFAVKVLDPGLFTNPEAVRRFEREARIAQAIAHPFTLRVLDHGRSDSGRPGGGPYLVLEYVEGELLSDLIEEGPLEPKRAVAIAGRIALALEAAHQKGVVHRDLSPTNVLLAQVAGKEFVKVSDFGLAMITESEEEQSDGKEATLTAVGVRIGTPTYMAPEYIEEYELDHRADIYGLGIMLYEMLTGAPPFTGRPYKVMEAHVHEPVPKPSSKRPDIPPWLDDLVFRLTAKRPDQRLQSAAEVAEAIERGTGVKIEVTEYRSPTAEPAPVRAQAPAPVDQKDPILEHFVTSNLGEVSRNKGIKAPPKDRRFLVTRVARESIAARTGVQVGYTLHLPDEDHGGLLDPRLWLHVVERRRWVFYTSDGGDRLEIVASGVPIGLEVCRSAENIVANYDPLLPEPAALLDLWSQQRWDELEKLSKATLLQQQRGGGGIGGNLFGRFLAGSEKRVLVDHPALLFHGIALVETKRPQGHLDVTEFAAKYASKWPNVYAALSDWYATMHQWKVVTEPHARQPLAEKLADVVLREPLPLLVKRYTELLGAAPPGSPWLGQPFAEYSMDSVDGKSTARLYETLERMDESQLLAVCLLGGYRGTPDYDAFMHRFANHMAFFEPFLYGLHVVTTQQEPEHDKPELYRGEAMVKGSRIPFVVLHDYRAFVQRAVKPPAIPTVYLIDRRGTCVHEGQLTDVDLWDALVLAGRMRVERFRGGGR
jgi:serine/threonine protein kinase